MGRPTSSRFPRTLHNDPPRSNSTELHKLTSPSGSSETADAPGARALSRFRGPQPIALAGSARLLEIVRTGITHPRGYRDATAIVRTQRDGTQ